MYSISCIVNFILRYIFYENVITKCEFPAFCFQFSGIFSEPNRAETFLKLLCIDKVSVDLLLMSFACTHPRELQYHITS